MVNNSNLPASSTLHLAESNAKKTRALQSTDHCQEKNIAKVEEQRNELKEKVSALEDIVVDMKALDAKRQKVLQKTEDHASKVLQKLKDCCDHDAHCFQRN
eukprot:11005287-Ditylum_brightwellii.AAC.1